MLGLGILLLAGCGAAAAGAAVASSIVSRAQGNCYAQCIAGTECDHATGICVARRADAALERLLPAPLPEAAPSGAASTAPAPTTVPLGYADESEGFACNTASGWSDYVLADSPETAQRVCAELNGEPCACVRGEPPTE